MTTTGLVHVMMDGVEKSVKHQIVTVTIMEVVSNLTSVIVLLTGLVTSVKNVLMIGKEKTVK